MNKLLLQIEQFLSQLTTKQPVTKDEPKMTDQLPVQDQSTTTVDNVITEAQTVIAAAEPVVQAVSAIIPQAAVADPFLRALGLVLSELGHDSEGIIGAASALAKLFK
ncbi:hypothetical protein [Tolumonas lignilytica]|uniref:hypothetical protein n=1 Tax=Tolumonas lignilytica TaxID=1283284 RepID=UPI000463F70D|nr:hypothetical protein [Tolumonas lignilytica]